MCVEYSKPIAATFDADPFAVIKAVPECFMVREIITQSNEKYFHDITTMPERTRPKARGCE